MPLAYAEELLGGEPGSNVEISILRLKNPDPQKLDLTLAKIDYPEVTAKLLPEQVGHVLVPSLEGNRVNEVKDKLASLKREGAKYVVLDLRHCSTGSQESGVPLANFFLEKGEIASLKGQKAGAQEFDARPDNDIWSGPLVVITDRATAGGAEIAASALEDDKRAQVVGERTYGDASVRKTIQLDDGSAVIISVAKYYSPSGKAIQDTGVVPTVEVAEADQGPELDQDGNPIPGTSPRNSEDNLLKQSIELVTGKTTVAELTSINSGFGTGEPHPIVQKSLHH
jgi:carboxyl-terminal processing protease